MLRLLELLWLGIGAGGCWSVHRHVTGVVRRATGFAFWTALCLLPVAWFEGRWLHWWWIQPRVGEPLDVVTSRLGPTTAQTQDGCWLIPFATPAYWFIPSFGLIRIATDSAGVVDSWSVTWR